MLLSSLSIVFLRKSSFFSAIRNFIILSRESQCSMALGVEGGSLSSFLINLSWKSYRSDMSVSFIPIQLSQLCSRAGITCASNSLVAARELPNPPIIGVSDT